MQWLSSTWMILMHGYKHLNIKPPCSNVLCPWLWNFDNCPIVKYIVLYHYTWRWLSASNSKVWARRLCLPTIDNIDYFGCDCMMWYFMRAKGSPFKSVVVGRPRWSDMEELCAQLCTMSFSQCGWPIWPIIGRGYFWPIMHVVWVSIRSHHYVYLW
jgi:hypothetical protein